MVPAEVRLECEVLKAVAARYVMDSPEATERYAGQRDAGRRSWWRRSPSGAPETLDPPLRASYEEAADDGGRLRVVLDQVRRHDRPGGCGCARPASVGPLT